MDVETTMDVPYRPASGREVRTAQTRREELVERVARAVGGDGDAEAPGGLRLLRRSSPTPEDHGVSSPAFYGGNASHFTREYERLFGAPPARDVGRLREAATMESASL